jgi:siroheme synthase (precorrin-2 oxidase/ferrochelatase)
MSVNTRRHSKEEMAERGEAIFEKDFRPRLKRASKRDFVAIDIATGDYEVDADVMAACNRLRARIPDAQVWMRRVGSPYARHFGGRPLGEYKKS